MSALEMRSIIVAGGDLIVDAKSMSALELRSLAMIAKTKGSRITIRNASSLSSLESRSIALIGGKGTITFDFVS